MSLHIETMAKPRRKTSKRKKKQSGGKMPWLVDFKKGFQVTKDMIQAVKKPIDRKNAQRQMNSYKEKFQEYKRKGGKKTFKRWAIDNGIFTRGNTCCIQ